MISVVFKNWAFRLLHTPQNGKAEADFTTGPIYGGSAEIETIAKDFGPGIDLAISGNLRRLGEIVIDDLLTPKEERISSAISSRPSRQIAGKSAPARLRRYFLRFKIKLRHAKQAEEIAAREYQTRSSVCKINGNASSLMEFLSRCAELSRRVPELLSQILDLESPNSGGTA